MILCAFSLIVLHDTFFYFKCFFSRRFQYTYIKLRYYSSLLALINHNICIKCKIWRTLSFTSYNELETSRHQSPRSHLSSFKCFNFQHKTWSSQTLTFKFPGMWVCVILLMSFLLVFLFFVFCNKSFLTPVILTIRVDYRWVSS